MSSLKRQAPAGGLLLKKKTTLPFFRQSSPSNLANLAERTSLNPLLQFAKLKSLNTVVRDGIPDAFVAPSFRPMPYGEAWYADVLAVYTNAVRYETKTFFFILYCLHERADTLEVGDIKSFYTWFEPYHNFFAALVQVLQATFLPWVERSADLPDSSPRAFFDTEAAGLQRTVRKTLKHKQDFLAYPPKKAAAKLRTIFNKFAIHLLTYISALENSTASIVESQYSVEECREISQKMVTVFLNKAHHKKNIVLLLRWFEDRHETTAQWRKQHLDMRTNMSYGRWKRPSAQEECLAYFRKKCKVMDEESCTHR